MITLCMIVKNEENVIERCLNSTIGLVDNVIVVDTGSTDRTKDIISAHPIPSKIYDKSWIDFGHNRNELLDIACNSDSEYLLLLDADMTVEFSSIPNLNQDSYRLRYSGDLDYQQKLLIRNKCGYKYYGATHEYIHSIEEKTSSLCKEIIVTHHADGGSRYDKFERDLKILEKQLIETPNDPRTIFYLARTEECLGNINKAMKYFTLRSQMIGSWEEERWFSQFKSAMLSSNEYELLKSWEARPSRGEPLYYLAGICRRRSSYHLAFMYAHMGTMIEYPKDDLLFIEKNIYQWGFQLELSLAQYYLGNFDSFNTINKKLLKMQLPSNIKNTIINNMTYTQKGL